MPDTPDHEFLNITPGDPAFEAELRRRSLQRIRELEKLYPRGKRHDLQLPADRPKEGWASPELWPGGPSTDTGDIELV